jgi:enterochelin esterase-like enzyme
MVGIHLRDALQVDSLLIISKWQFRSFEYVKSFPLYDSSRLEELKKPILLDRYARYCDFITEEVAGNIKTIYRLKTNKKFWTIGGYSNGGTFVLSYTAENTKLFGNAIAMSPGFNDKTNGFTFPSKSDIKYYLCAGTGEPDFLTSSLDILPRFNVKGIAYIHQTFNVGHDWRMWYTFYKFSIKDIYKIHQ